MAEQRITLSGFQKGVITRGVNQFDSPQDALKDGLNVDVSEGLKTRDGCTIVSEDSLPVGTVRALKQVRFPTNETSKLVPQVEFEPSIFSEQADLGVQCAVHTNIWDPVGERMFVVDSGLAMIWMFTPNSEGGVWYEVPDSADLDTVYNASVIYDEIGGRIVIRGGLYVGGSSPATSQVWTFDCSALTFSSHTATGTKPISWAGYPAIFRDNGGSGQMVLYCPTAAPYGSACDLYSLDLGTWVWTKLGTAGCPITYNGGDSKAVWVAGTDDILIYGVGDTGSVDLWRYRFGTGVWTKLTSNNVSPDFTRFHNAVVLVGSKLYTIWGEYDTSSGGGLRETELERVGEIYDIATDTWSVLTIAGAPLPRFYHSTCVTGSNQILLHGGREIDPGGPDISGLWLMEPIEGVPLTTQNRLYASDDLLPTTTATFTEIYDLGDGAGAVNISVLNDRAIITEGVSEPPLVYPGTESATGSDWASPKTVLVTPDGDNYYDVSSDVCDKDPDSVADIGSITPMGHLDICCDMPEVSDFYFEIQTANTGQGVAPIYDQQEALADSGEVNQYDFKATITHWHQNSGATGHFENAAHTTITLGAGKVNPDVIVGTRVVFSDATAGYISAITGDGSGVGSVTLTIEKATTNIDYIYGTDFIDSELTVACTYGDLAVDTFSITPASHIALGGAFSVRQVIKGADISTTLGTIQIELNTINAALTGWVSNMGLTLTGISIVPRDGSTVNGTTTPTLITFPYFYESYGMTRIDGGLHLEREGSLGQLTAATSEKVTFTLTSGVDYLLIMDFYDVTGGGPSSSLRNVAALNTSGGHGGYYVCAGSTTSDQNSTALNDYTSYGHVVALSKISGTTTSAAPQVIEVATTNATSQISLAGVEALTGIQVSETKPVGTEAWYALSFDGRATFSVFLASAWKLIVRESGGNWQYLAAGTPQTWQNATVDSVYHAIKQAMAVAANQMSGTVLAAITSAELVDTGGVVANVTQTLDLAVGLKPNADNALPSVASWSAGLNIASTSVLSGYQDGAYSIGSGWTDGTATAGVTLAKSGIISYDGASAFEADYSVLNGVPGYWYRLNTNGTSAGTAITRILYKAPCQPLANIGDGQPDTVNGFLFMDTSKNSLQDFTELVSDNTLTNFSSALIPMNTDDYLYVGFYEQFNCCEMTPESANNQVVSTLSAEYWNGTAWTALTIVDGTTSSTAQTLSGKGKITWDLPTDWRRNIPFDSFLSRAYWVRFKVSVALTSTAAIAECRVYSVPPALKKHKYAEVAGSKVFLANRPDNANQIDISRELEEYGFCGSTSWSGNVGGQDAIVGLTAAYDRLFVWKPSSVHLWTGERFEGAEAAGKTPINSQSVVKATVDGKTGLFFLNRSGVYVIQGLQADNTFSTAAISELSSQLNYWDANAGVRLDMNYLHLACGEFWSKKNWIVWSVPMILTGSTQATNNVLLVYDLNFKCWLPLFTFPFGIASLCVAYTDNASAPQRLGDQILLAGTYDGRIVRLFDPTATDDLGTPIAAYAETGWLHHGADGVVKMLQGVDIYGTTVDSSISLQITGRFNAGQASRQSTTATLEFPDLFNVTNHVGVGHRECVPGVQGNLLKYRLDWTGATEICAIGLDLSGEFKGARS